VGAAAGGVEVTVSKLSRAFEDNEGKEVSGRLSVTERQREGDEVMRQRVASITHLSLSL
jgi:hypothetical protein